MASTGPLKAPDLQRLLRPNILNLKPYRCARHDFSTGILLDANESSYGPCVDDYYSLELNRYPDPYHRELSKRVSQFRGVEPDEVFFGVGSDEAIDLAIRIFCEPGKHKILITPPTYGMYQVSASINNVSVVSVPLLPDTFQLDVQEMLQQADEDVKLIFLCSPGNPTAARLNKDDVIRLLENYHGIVAIDEAYVDFDDEPSFAFLIKEYSHAIIMQTLSKAFGLAGIRIGIALAHKEIIKIFNNVKAPYNINKITEHLALSAFENIEVVKQNVAKCKEERERVRKELENLPSVHKVFPSSTNYLLVKMDNAKTVWNKMCNRGIVIRYRGDCINCDNCIRITIGQPHENDAMLKNIKEVFEEASL